MKLMVLFNFAPTCKYGLQVHLNYSEFPNSCLIISQSQGVK
jgi:hypothetical protein